jgi:hypothetical protein
MVSFSLRSVLLFVVSGAAVLALPKPASKRIALPNDPWPDRVLTVMTDTTCGPIGATRTSLHLTPLPIPTTKTDTDTGTIWQSTRQSSQAPTDLNRGSAVD